MGARASVQPSLRKAASAVAATSKRLLPSASTLWVIPSALLTVTRQRRRAGTAFGYHGHSPLIRLMGRKSRNKKQRKEHARQRRIGYEIPAARKYPLQPRPSRGITAAERDVAALCRKAFLSLWTYPNVYRAEKQPNGGVISKEVCDLLVLFGEHVLIFSDKDCAFRDSGDLGRDWSRWYSRAIGHSAKQLFGAERVIRGREPLFLDKELTTPLPLPLPPADRMKVHRIVVAHGACEKCRDVLGGSGSLVLDPSVAGDQHLAAFGGRPFVVGQVTPSKGYVHVMDDTSLAFVMSVLDTAADFTNYLEKKEQLMRSGALALATGEEALLGWFMGRVNAQDQHDFVLPPDANGPLAVDESWWQRFIMGPEAAAKFEADRISYLWDDLIEKFTHHFQEGTSDFLTDTTAASMDASLRFFVRENRTRRRALATALIDAVQTTPADKRRLRVVPPSGPGDPYWVLLLLPFPAGVPYRVYRDVRRRYLEWCCMVVRLDNPDALDIVGFATEAGNESDHRSEDAAYFDARVWNPALEAEARELKLQHGILISPRMLPLSIKEYPDS